MKLRKIKLFGKLAKLCKTNEVELVGDDMRIITAGLVNMFGVEVKNFIRNNKFHILVKSKKTKYKDLSMDNITHKLDSSVDQIKIMPVIEGAGGKLFNIIVGIVLIVVGVWTGNYQLAVTGGAMLLGGLLTPSLPNSREEKPNSFIFNQPNNVTEQGQPVNIVYGRFKCGSIIASSGQYADYLFGGTVGWTNDPLPEPSPWTAPL